MFEALGVTLNRQLISLDKADSGIGSACCGSAIRTVAVRGECGFTVRLIENISAEAFPSEYRHGFYLYG